MKVLLNLIVVLFLSALSGCLPLEDDSVTLSFWTDRVMVEDGYKMVFVNDNYIGDLNEGVRSPVCSEEGLLNYQMEHSEDLHLSIRNDDGEAIDVGVVNLYSVSTGIKIKPSKNSKIFVDHALDSNCTLVYLNWK